MRIIYSNALLKNFFSFPNKFQLRSKYYSYLISFFQLQCMYSEKRIDKILISFYVKLISKYLEYQSKNVNENEKFCISFQIKNMLIGT